jgi:hypothetical protein
MDINQNFWSFYVTTIPHCRLPFHHCILILWLISTNKLVDSLPNLAIGVPRIATVGVTVPASPQLLAQPNFGLHVRCSTLFKASVTRYTRYFLRTIKSVSGLVQLYTNLYTKSSDTYYGPEGVPFFESMSICVLAADRFKFS